MNQFLIFATICMVLMGISGCGKQNSELNDESGEQTQISDTSSESDERSSIKTEAEILNDLNGNMDFYTLFDYNCYDGNGNYTDSTFSIDELTISKRKTNTENGIDDVYTAVTAISPESKYVGNFHLLYTFYDVGGWCLDNIELESGELEPLFHVSDAEVYNIVLNITEPLGANTSDSYIDSRSTLEDTVEVVTAKVDFNDGIIAVTGSIDLLFYFDGELWTHEQTSYDLSYDIIAEGTYESLNHSGYPDFLVINHENGVPVVRRTSGWAGGIDPFKVKDWEFDCLSRSYVYGGGINGDIPCEYRFGTDGNIYYSINGVPDKTLYRIADPIADADVLWTTLKQSGNAW